MRVLKHADDLPVTTVDHDDFIKIFSCDPISAGIWFYMHTVPEGVIGRPSYVQELLCIDQDEFDLGMQILRDLGYIHTVQDH